MDRIECVICLNDISNNDNYTLTCCKNEVHIYCLNDWVNTNITNKNVAKCFICSQENSMIENLVAYNKICHNNNEIIFDYDYNNNIINHNNSNNSDSDVVLHDDSNMLTIAYNIDKRLYYLFISVKVSFFILAVTVLMLLLYYIS